MTLSLCCSDQPQTSNLLSVGITGLFYKLAEKFYVKKWQALADHGGIKFVILVLGRQRKKNQEFKISLSYIVTWKQFSTI
jgi:hypothetical protein